MGSADEDRSREKYFGVRYSFRRVVAGFWVCTGGASLAQCFKCEAISLPGTALVESWNHHHPHPTAADLPEQIGLDWIGLFDCPKETLLVCGRPLRPASS
jgi:hypothetical protein